MSDAVRAALAALVPRLCPGAAGLSSARRLSGGASQESWLIDVAGPGGERRFVLRRAPAVVWDGSMGVGLSTEARLMALAGAAGVPSPRVVHVLSPDDGLGDGFVMDFVAGETIGQKILRDPALAAIRPALGPQCGRILAAIHGLDVADVPGLRLQGAADQVTELAAIVDRLTTPRPVFRLALRWLSDHLPPPPDNPCLVHGDFRNGNLIVGPDGIRAVLDWELAHLGDPMEDLGWIAVNSWRFGEIDCPIGGFGDRDSFHAAYEAAGGQRVDAATVRFFEVLGTLRWGVICAGNGDVLDLAATNAVERCVIGRRASETELDLLNLIAKAA